jgi:hypothetical protein
VKSLFLLSFSSCTLIVLDFIRDNMEQIIELAILTFLSVFNLLFKRNSSLLFANIKEERMFQVLYVFDV